MFAILSLSSCRPLIYLVNKFYSLSLSSRCFFKLSTSPLSCLFSSANLELNSCQKSRSLLMFVTFPFQKLSSFLQWLSFYSVISSLLLISEFSDYLLIRSCSSFNILSVNTFLSALQADLNCSALFLSSIVFTFSISSSWSLFSISAY